MIFKIVLVSFLVIANGFFVAAEFALVKLKIREIKDLIKRGSKPAKTVEHIIKNIDAYLSACQLGITLASLGLGWVGEPLVAKSIEPLLEIFEIPESKSHYIAFPLAFTFITLLHITIGEQVPKIYAIQKYKRTSLLTAYPLIIFYKIFKPFIWILNEISNLMLRSIGINAQAGHGEAHSEDELRAILLESASVGNLTIRERLLMENVLDLEDKIARRYMIPRNQIIYIDKNSSMEEKLNIASVHNHTRYPLCDDDLDNVIGIVHVKDIFQAYAKKSEISSLEDIAREPTFLPETIALDVLLREFQKKQTVLAMLVDEYGVVSGMITIENVLEELVGPIQDEFDTEEPQIIDKGEGKHEVDASCSIDQIERHLDINLNETRADTIGGVVIEEFGYIPSTNEEIVIGEYLYKVLEAEPTRVIKVSMTKLKPKEIEEAAESELED